MEWRLEDSLLLCQYVLDNRLRIRDLMEFHLNEMQENGFLVDISLQQCIWHLRGKVSKGKQLIKEYDITTIQNQKGLTVEEISRVLGKKVEVVFYQLYSSMENAGLLGSNEVARRVKWSTTEVEWLKGKIEAGVDTLEAYELYKEKYGVRRSAEGFTSKYKRERGKTGLVAKRNRYHYTQEEKTLLYNLGLTKVATSRVKEEMEKKGYCHTERAIEAFWTLCGVKCKPYGVLEKDKLKEVIKRWRDGTCVVEIATDMELPIDQVFYNIRSLAVYTRAMVYGEEEEAIVKEGLRLNLTIAEVHQKIVEWRIERGLPPRTLSGVKGKLWSMRKGSREC